MRYALAALDASHAADAAAIHAEGQPGTFLSNLGPAFLKALYVEMAESSLCFGHVAVADDGHVLGVVVGTIDAGEVFKQMIWRRGWRLAPSVAWALLQKPSLFAQVWETLSYPGQVEDALDEAELFFIGTRLEAREQGVGAALFDGLAAEARKRGKRTLGLTVDATNAIAQRFYQARGMGETRAMTLYGRAMYWYEMPLRLED